MNRIITTALFISCFSASSFSQWFEQNSGTTENLRNVFFIDENTGWVSGDDGVILKTTDSGETWVKKESGTTDQITSIHFSNNDFGWAIIKSPEKIIISTDGGEIWTDRSVPISFLEDAYFIDSQSGWAVGGGDAANKYSLLKTTDGGINWIGQDSSSAYFYKIQFVSSHTAFISGTFPLQNIGEILKTSDDGTTWESNVLSDYSQITSLYFIDENTGWVTGNKDINNVARFLVSKTTDGGKTFNTQKTFSDQYTESIYFVSSTHGWVTGNSLHFTTDGGSNWIETDPGDIIINDIYFVSETTGWIIGLDGKIFKTNNGGITSAEVESLIPNNFSLSQNFPNPFNPVTKINFAIPISEHVTLKVYDMLGSEAATLLNERKSAGIYSVDFDGSKLTSGMYFYILSAGDFSETRKMMLLK